MRQMLLCFVSLISLAPVFADDTFTSPQTIVNARIEPAPIGDDMLLTGAQLYFDTIESSFHLEAPRDRSELANRTQNVTLLQSKLVSFGCRQLKFRTVAGAELTVEEVQVSLKKNPLVLLVPFGASIHPQLVVALNPDTVIVTRANSRMAPQRLVPRPDGG